MNERRRRRGEIECGPHFKLHRAPRVIPYVMSTQLLGNPIVLCSHFIKTTFHLPPPLVDIVYGNPSFFSHSSPDPNLSKQRGISLPLLRFRSCPIQPRGKKSKGMRPSSVGREGREPDTHPLWAPDISAPSANRNNRRRFSPTRFRIRFR